MKNVTLKNIYLTYPVLSLMDNEEINELAVQIEIYDKNFYKACQEVLRQRNAAV